MPTPVGAEQGGPGRNARGVSNQRTRIECFASLCGAKSLAASRPEGGAATMTERKRRAHIAQQSQAVEALFEARRLELA